MIRGEPRDPHGIGKRKSIGGKTIHQFGSTGQAYDRTQYDSAIKMGDVLDVPSEKVAGFMFSAWPVSVSPEHGELHSLTNPSMPPSAYPDARSGDESYDVSHASARALSRKRGYGVA